MALRRWRLWRRRTARTITAMARTSTSSVVMRSKLPAHRPWLTGLLARRPTKIAAIALDNKLARITIDQIYLDDVQGRRISISGHDGQWPISTVKFIQS